MWSKKGMPVSMDDLPAPSMFNLTAMRVSLVVRRSSARRVFISAHLTKSASQTQSSNHPSRPETFPKPPAPATQQPAANSQARLVSLQNSVGSPGQILGNAGVLDGLSQILGSRFVCLPQRLSQGDSSEPGLLLVFGITQIG